MDKRKQVFQKDLLTLTQLKMGQTGTVVELDGGSRFARRLDALGIRPGGKVIKVSSMLFRGPVVIKIGNSQIAIGFGMANRVWVEPEKSK
jgi:ferrous iron transport protein A